MEIIQPKKPCTRPVRALTTALNGIENRLKAEKQNIQNALLSLLL